MSKGPVKNENVGHASLAPGVYQPGRIQQQRDEKRRSSTETDASWDKCDHSSSPNSDAGLSGISPRTELSAADEVEHGAGSAREGSTMSSPPSQDKSPEQGDYITLQREFASKRSGWSQSRNNWFNAVWAWWLKLKPDMESREDFKQLDHDLGDLRDMGNEFEDCDRKLDELDAVLNLRPDLNVLSPPSITVVPPVVNAAARPLPDSVDAVLDQTKDFSAEEDYKAQYYSHVATIRYLSDALINHGPTPDERQEFSEGFYDELDDQSYGEGNGYEDDYADGTDMSSDAPDPYEHGAVYLQLCNELEHERREAARYKRLCMLNNIDLEDILDDVGSQEDGEYQTLFNGVVSAPARVDAMVAVSQGPQQHDTSVDPSAVRSSRGFRTAEWAASLTIPPRRAEEETPVSPTTIMPNTLLNEGIDTPQFPKDIDNVDEGSLQALRQDRRHTRSKSTSATYQRPATANLEQSDRLRSVSFSLSAPVSLRCYSFTG